MVCNLNKIKRGSYRSVCHSIESSLSALLFSIITLDGREGVGNKNER